MKMKILIVGLILSTIVTVTAFAQNGVSRITRTTCPQKPTVIFTGGANLQGGQRSPFGLQVSSGSLQQVKNYVEKGCKVSVLLSDAAFSASDLHTCSSVNTGASNFKCHFGQTHQIIQPLGGNATNAILEDTYVDISQTGDNEFSLRTEGISGGSGGGVFKPVAWYGENNTGVINIYAAR